MKIRRWWKKLRNYGGTRSHNILAPRGAKTLFISQTMPASSQKLPPPVESAKTDEKFT
jgi:hypothetical protein